ncbi:unannotated protein [freshwater metagenome]|uniref:Unannotated protein n=1 Tax=freshwater metagenome TaxID=449393 RepID=A0A6J7R222_9ZZZZ|nr:DUF459 domain-containing protein [Actinomycetota bacterium]MSX15135.1 DUF459 domain-containing protein [Actinomycetota bacterium]MSX35620.1 DUF459 domain-containing protein [Actinomycetota bacterium]MSZ71355.1 DUF459 domain-containing protein [Actinomycetota bacterium]MUH56743.1 DUF459 domain-containing protein [Actinomycetota bacterium]
MSESENETSPRSTPLPREVYARRRMLVGLGVVAGLMAIIFAVQAVSSDSPPSDTRLSVDENVLTPTSTPQELGLVTTLPPDTTSTTTTVVIQGPPRVSIYGDSLAAGFGGLLKSTLDQQGVTTFLATHGSSGLSQPGFFDWPNHLNVWVPQENADVVVIGLGANDGQDLYVDGVSHTTKDPEWSVEYQRRVTELVTLVTSQGRSLVWVGTPDGKAKGFRANLATLRTATKNAIDVVRASGADVVYLDVWDLFLGFDGNYSQYVIDPSDGERKKSRDSDGFHLSLVGNKILAAAITAEVDAAFERQAAQ